MKGFKVIQLRGDSHWKVRDAVSNFLGVSLQAYNEKHSTELHVRTSKFVHGLKEWRQMLKDNETELEPFVGKNFIYQQEPFLRIARPDMHEDNIGIHRDTHYGATDQEWVMWVPLTDAVYGGELRILPGSHLEPDETYPYKQVDNEEVCKGSDKHWLGFRYAPKVFSEETENLCVPVPCSVGQAIVFNCGLIHGQKVNAAPWTRFSLDIRIAPKDSGVKLDRGAHEREWE